MGTPQRDFLSVITLGDASWDTQVGVPPLVTPLRDTPWGKHFGDQTFRDTLCRTPLGGPPLGERFWGPLLGETP
jgi:hypothetical protein